MVDDIWWVGERRVYVCMYIWERAMITFKSKRGSGDRGLLKKQGEPYVVGLVNMWKTGGARVKEFENHMDVIIARAL